MAATAEADQLVRSFNLALTRLRDRTASVVLATWDLHDNIDDAALSSFVRRVTPMVAGAQAAVVNAADAYLATFVALELGEPAAPKGLDAVAIARASRGGVTLDEVYARPFVTARTLISRGEPFARARQAARARLDATVQADVMLAHRDAVSTWTKGERRITGYHRVLSGKSCGLCVAASAQRYSTGQLMPIHNRCDCTVEPIIGTSTRSAANAQRYENLKRAAPNMNRSELARLHLDEQGRLPEVRVVEHGEMGPTLIDAHDRFTTPADLAG